MNMLRRVKLQVRNHLIIRLIDAYTGLGPIDPELQIQIEHVFQKPLFKPEGYIIFSGVLAGSYQLNVTSRWYEEIRVTVQVENGQEPTMIHLVLLPRPNYPSGRGATVVRGMVVDGEGRPLSGMEVHAKLTGRLAAKARLSQEAQKNQTELMLNYVNGRLRIGEQFWLSGDSQEKDDGVSSGGEIIQVANISDDGKRGMVLQTPLSFQHKRGSLLSPFIKAFSSKKGEIAIFFASGRSKQYTAELLFHHNQKKHAKEVRLEEGSTLNMGVISLAD